MNAQQYQHIREAWLTAFTDGLRPMFEDAGAAIPEKVRSSVGWPSKQALAPKYRVLGQCWSPRCSSEGVIEIFISPLVGDAVEVGEILAHELVHAAVGTACGHRGAFKRLALTIGLVGPMRSTRAGDELREHLNALQREIGPYPHAAMAISSVSRQKTRMLKIECPACEYRARVSQKWLDVGAPTCPCGTVMRHMP